MPHALSTKTSTLLGQTPAVFLAPLPLVVERMQSRLWLCWLLLPVLMASPKAFNLQTLPCSYGFHSYISPNLGRCSFSLQYVLPLISAAHSTNLTVAQA